MDGIGIFLLDNSLNRPLGDVGNPDTFNFPVTMAKSPGAKTELVVEQSGAGVLDAVQRAARGLQEAGVRAITSCCGFFAIFQRELANTLDVPVATSSLLQAPLVLRMLRDDQTVCVVTANATTLTRQHFEAIGVGDALVDRVHLAGLENCTHFWDFITEKVALDLAVAEAEIVEVVSRAVADRPDTGALLLECTNLPPFTEAIKQATGLPVWDAVTMINWLHAGVARKAQPGHCR